MSCVKQTTKKYLSRPSPPYSAQDCPNKTKTGNDKNQWTSTLISNVYKWVKENEYEKTFIAIRKKVFNKAYKQFWHALATGSFFLIYNDNTYKIKTLKKFEFDAIYDDPKIKYNVWTSRSTDELFFFVYYLLTKLSKKEINAIISGKIKIIDMIVDDPQKYLQKGKLFGEKDYYLRQLYDDKINMKRIVEKMA